MALAELADASASSVQHALGTVLFNCVLVLNTLRVSFVMQFHHLLASLLGHPRPFPASGRSPSSAHHQDDLNRFSRQRGNQNRFGGSNNRAGADGDQLDIGTIAAAGERCIDKVVMVEETEYDEHIECHHSYSERCHTTYTTDFEPQQEEECDENFKKSCFIEYKKIAFDEPIRFCHTPLICEGEGPEECKTVYESECETRYHQHDVEDDIVECETIQVP